MTAAFARILAIVIFPSLVACGVAQNAAEKAPPERLPITGPAPSVLPPLKTAVFAGGCFWGVEAVFEHVKGVVEARSGYAGGDAKTAAYRLVSNGSTGHAEAVEVIFDPAVISYDQLLEIFFLVAHDPTQLNRQGPDEGTQYRSAIFYKDEGQKRAALAYIEKLTVEKHFPRPIVTEVTGLPAFYPAEAYHQNYLKRNPNQPYIVINDKPKIAALKKQFPNIYKER